VDKNLSPRPNLDHLRRQAKSLLAGLESGDPEAIKTIQDFLPAVKGTRPAQIRAAGLRLADAQSAIARKSGFASWPQLARHVEQLRALEGTWTFVSLELDGTTVPAAAMQASRLLIDGDRFRMESPEATYEGVFNIDVEAQPHRIDIEFVEGPEAGNWNYGIFRIEGDRLEICLDVNGKPHPGQFRAPAGSGHAYETLVRASTARPESVTGGARAGKAQNAAGASAASGDAPNQAAFGYTPSETLTRLQGEWSTQELKRDGMKMPAAAMKTGRRVARENDIKIYFGGQLMIHALVRLNEATQPIEIDYFNLAGMSKGAVQLGIMEWRGEEVCFCMAAPGQPRPTDFTCDAGSGRTQSQWRPKR